MTAGLSGRNTPETDPIHGLSYPNFTLENGIKTYYCRDGVVVKNTLLTCKGPGFGSQYHITYDI